MTEVISSSTESAQPIKWFTNIQDSTQEHWDLLKEDDIEQKARLADNVYNALLLLDEPDSFHVTRLEHSLETATMAYRDNKDDEYITLCLLHDIGDTLGAYNHADVVSAIIRPFAREDYYWMIEKHAIFQGYYFWQYIGRDQNAREKYRGNPYFDLCEEFCEVYDQAAFDPNYKWMPLDAFKPLLQDFFSEPRAYMREAEAEAATAAP